MTREAFEYLSQKPGLTTKNVKTLQERTFYGKEKKSLAYVIAIMNMILHGIGARPAELKLANCELGTVEGINEGRMALRVDDGRSVDIDPAKHPHLDHGYAVTSHSSQGQTADRMLIHVDTELGAKDLLNNRMAMSPSRVERMTLSFLRMTGMA